LTNGELDHDSCEATVSTEGADHDIIKICLDEIMEVAYGRKL